MRLWLKTLISNRFFQVSAGILITMVIGGLVIQVLETGEITEGDTPFWWAIVTMTTVGYGDIAPVTVIGQTIASFIMLIGYAIIAVPTGIVSAEMVKGDKKVDQNTQACRSCNADEHADGAKYCNKCGEAL